VVVAPEALGVTLLLCGALSALAYFRAVLTWDGSLAAFVVGLLIGVLGDVTWLLLLLFFLLSSFGATRYRFALKKALGVQEGRLGERRSANVLANGIAPVAVAAFSFFEAGPPRDLSGLVYVSVLAVAGADTLASEIGVLSPDAYLITNGKKVPPGTDGAVSVLGQGCALAAAVYTAFIGWLVLGVLAPMIGTVATIPANSFLILVPAGVGFIGCQIDSVLGATLERRGFIGKKGVNLISTASGGVLAYGLMAVAGVV
jgi:uncharacterized protein (TIGR00297 family)